MENKWHLKKTQTQNMVFSLAKQYLVGNIRKEIVRCYSRYKGNYWCSPLEEALNFKDNSEIMMNMIIMMKGYENKSIQKNQLAIRWVYDEESWAKDKYSWIFHWSDCTHTPIATYQQIKGCLKWNGIWAGWHYWSLHFMRNWLYLHYYMVSVNIVTKEVI